MSSRFTTNLGLLMVAGTLIVAAFAFPPGVVGWLALGTGAAAVVVALIGFGLRGRGAAQRALDLPAALAGGWLIVAARAFAGPTVKWLSFADAALLAGLSVLGLILHELGAKRRAAAVAGEATAERWRARQAGFDPHPLTGGVPAGPPDGPEPVGAGRGANGQ